MVMIKLVFDSFFSARAERLPALPRFSGRTPDPKQEEAMPLAGHIDNLKGIGSLEKSISWGTRYPTG
jgi:hypothetical protein